MNEWELTSDEIKGIIEWCEKIAPLDMQRAEQGGCEHAIAKAAQKKLMNYLEKNEDKGGFKEMFFVCIPRDIWLELRKSVGLEP